MSHQKIRVIGAGLAGSEAAWQIAQKGIEVDLIEMRPSVMTPAHTTADCAELVCSNSLRSDDMQTNAVGLLHEELRRMGSLIMVAADACSVPAGGALAVNRVDFAKMITRKLKNHPLIHFSIAEMGIPTDDIPTIIATGPLTSPKMAEDIQKITGDESLHFFDAIAPIVYTDSINMEKAWYQSRYDKGDKYDYLNLALNKEQYYQFVQNLLAGEKIAFKEWEKNTPYFEGCLPIEVMAERGVDTLAFGPMKPVGLRSPHLTEKPKAVVQLRKENKEGTLMNMVGFQTKLTYKEQTRIFRTIPGLENAVFARLGGIHRNTFVCGPKVLDEQLRLKNKPSIRLAGQVSGCEGYVESTAMGLLAGLFAVNPNIQLPPDTTALGAMLRHVTAGNPETYQPMNINFGLFPEPETEGARKIKGADRKKLYTTRALRDLEAWKKQINL